jgi:hypothetical protein
MMNGVTTFCQDSIRAGNWVTADFHYGIIPPIYSEAMNYLIKAHIPALELDYVHKPEELSGMERDYRDAETGVAFYYAWLGNPSELGNLMGAYPFISFHLKRCYHEGFYIRTGIGLAYLPVTFNRLSNHKDNFIGTHLNTLFDFRLTRHFYLCNNLRIEAGIELTHSSNGSFKTPDLGVNLLTASTGISFCNAPKWTHIKKDTGTIPKKDWVNVFILAGGVSQVEPPDGVYYPVATFTYSLYKNLNRKNRIGGGLDIFYNNANIERLGENILPIENTQVGIKGTYEMRISQLSLPFEMGVYLYSRYQGNGIVYDRIGLRYYTKYHIIYNLTLLSHFAKSDFVEWGIGYKL